VRSSDSDSTYKEWFYTQGVQSGSHTFKGLPAGEYEVRVYFDWPAGGYNVRVRYPITVSASGDTYGSSAVDEDSDASLWLDKSSFSPNESITVHFTASSSYANNAWVGIIPSHVSHGSESENDRHDIAYQYLRKRTSGDLTFTAPSSPGDYDFRMHDTDSSGSEVADVSFSVEGGTAPVITPRSGSGSGSGDVIVYVYSLNYKGMVTLNGEDYYEIKGEKDMNYNYSGPANFISGTNVFELEYEALPDSWKTSFTLKVYRYDWDTQTEDVIGEWTVEDEGGERTFEVDF
jgi:hypothetical protein